MIMETDDTPSTIPPDPPRQRRRRWPWVMGGLTVAAIIGSFFIPVPYLLFAPGSARSVSDRITIGDGKGFDDSGEVLFLTVSEQEATVATAVWAWVDDTVDSVPIEDVRTGTAEEDRVENQARMDESKFVATSLALSKVGYEVKETGTGAFVDRLLDGFPAKELIRQGEVITAVDGAAVAVSSDLRSALAGRPVGTEVELTLREPDGTVRTQQVMLGMNPEDTSRGFLGLVSQTADRDLLLPFPIEFETGRVTGPSAGLAFTLGLVDRLTDGDLTSGRVTAVTGTIDAAGNVGPIGGIAQKAVAALDAQATLMLYPAATSAEDVVRVRGIVGDRIELHAVATLDEALAVLAPNGLPTARK